APAPAAGPARAPPPAVPTGDARGDREAQAAVAVGARCPFARPVREEALEDALHVLRRNPRSAIRDPDDGGGVEALEADDDFAAVGTEPGRVVEEIFDDLADTI